MKFSEISLYLYSVFVVNVAPLNFFSGAILTEIQ